MTTAASGQSPAESGDFPPVFYGTIRAIDGFSNLTGQVFAIVQIYLVAIICYEVFSRYFLGSPTVWVYEAGTMANGASFMLACGYALYKGAHVRTDIFWEKFSERRKGVIDLVSYLVLFFPSMIFLMAVGIDGAWHSFTVGERSQESIWRAIMWPFRSAVPLAALLFMIQGVSESLKCCYQIRFGREFQHREKIEV